MKAGVQQLTPPKPENRAPSQLEFRAQQIAEILFSHRLPYFHIVVLTAALLSAISAYLFVNEGLHVAHFDAKGHLLVPRRIFDNLSPGFKQIGAFWLPLPHWIYLPFVKSDALYFGGTAALPITMVCFVATVAVLFKMIERVLTPFAAFCGSVLYAVNANMLYLQTTPLTENLSLLFFLGAVYLFVDFANTGSRKSLFFSSLVSSLGILTRYENWFVFATIGLLLIALHIRKWNGLKPLIIDCFLFGIFGALAAAFSFWINWYTTGQAYMDHSFKHTDFQPAEGSWFLSFVVILYTVGNLISYEWTLFALICAVFFVRAKYRDPSFIASLALLAPFILYLYEYYDNHPMRIRYGLPLVPAFFYILSYWPTRSRLMTYLFLVFAVYVAIGSHGAKVASAQLLQESMRDAENLALQQDLVWYFKNHDDGRPVLAAMAEVAPLLYDLKVPVKRYIHEGAKPYWTDALRHPEKLAGWVFMTQDDTLWRRFHGDSEFHRNFELIGRSGFLELYRRGHDPARNQKSHRPHPSLDKNSGQRNLPVT